MQHHTKTLGDEGVGYVIADLLRRGISPCIPISEHQAYDLVAANGSDLRRIQVKSRSVRPNGTIYVKASSYSWNGCDVIAIYNVDCKEIYYVTQGLIPSDEITLRVEPTKNGQLSNVVFADNFLDYPAP